LERLSLAKPPSTGSKLPDLATTCAAFADKTAENGSESLQFQATAG
jgi:hypothetical protein